MPSFSNLLSPIVIGGVTLRNRMVSTAHGTSMGRDYLPTVQMAEYHARRARGGIGLIIMEGARVHPSSRPGTSTPIGWDASIIPAYRLISDAVHREGGLVFAQLVHNGRQANSRTTGTPVWSASALPTNAPGEVAHSMSLADIQVATAAFAQTALYMREADMDGVEIHGAHGYLLTQFLSARTNQRSDAYGGALANRARLTLEVCAAVRAAVGRSYPVGIRLSAEELVPGGITLDETLEVCRWLQTAGTVDFLDISQGSQGPDFVTSELIPDMSFGQAPWVHYAAAVKRATRRLPVFTVGRIVDPLVAEDILAMGQADLICMTRAHIADPDIALKLAAGRPEDIRACIGCNQGCIGRRVQDKPVSCTVNPEASRESELTPISRTTRPKHVVVVGAGPAGMEAARVAALAGHRVTLVERSARVGGQLNILVQAPHRQDFHKIVTWLERQLHALGVALQFNLEATVATLAELHPDVIMLATGSSPVLAPLLGVDLAHGPPVATVPAVLEGRALALHAVVIDALGVYKALSVAEFLADHGCRVDLVTAAPTLGQNLVTWSRAAALNRLVAKGVWLHTGLTLTEAVGSLLRFRSLDAQLHTFEDVDLLVPVVPNQPNNALAVELSASRLVPNLVSVGDCRQPALALDAIWDGHFAARSL